MTEETLLIGRMRIRELYNKLEKFPKASSICPRCDNIFSDKYDACDCVRFSIHD